MKTLIETITPNKAAQYLETVDTSKQRPLRLSKIDNYAVAMARGHWMLTHQGIAFDCSGNLCDGQHRLHAVVKSGVTVRMLVTREMDEKQGDLFTFDAIDQGVKRNIGEQLQVRHGVMNATHIAAGARKIAHLCSVSSNVTMTVANTLGVLSYYGKELQYCHSVLRPTAGMTRAPILGAAAFCLRPGGDLVKRFIESVGTGENLAKRNPAYMFRQYALNYRCVGGGRNSPLEQAFCLCAMHAMLGNEVKVIRTGMRGIDFFADKQPRVVKAISDMFTI